MTESDTAQTDAPLTAEELQETWRLLSPEERLEGFQLLPQHQAEEFLLELPARESAQLLLLLPPEGRRLWMRLLAPDDAADLIQEAPAEERESLLALLDESTRREVSALMAYAEDDAGGLMNPRYGRLRPDMTADEAISYLRKQTREKLETIYYVYVLDNEQHLRGVISFRTLFAAPPEARIQELMTPDPVSAPEDMDQEELSRLFAQHGFIAIPVVDAEKRMKGIVTVDDIVGVVEEEATEDIQKIGGTQALDAPYLDTPFVEMFRKRGGWLAVLFVGEILTASAMGRYEHEIQNAVVLALFVPLIISSGGNSGSQASTLVIRAMALGQVSLSDWWRVIRRELMAGLALGLGLSVIGFARIVAWQTMFHTYGEHWLAVAFTVAISVVGVVTFGTLAGSMLPFILRRFRLDPASASAPFVATLVDVSGIVLYFSVAHIILGGKLL